MKSPRTLILMVAAGLLVVSAAAEVKQKTVITGDEMEIINNGDRVIFSGKAKVTRGKSVLNADTLVQDKKRDEVEASGNVNFSLFNQQDEEIKGSSGKAVYRPKTGAGTLSGGRPVVTYHVRNSTGPITLEADTVSFDQDREEIGADGDVVIVSSSATVRTPKALFLQKERKALLSAVPGGPRPSVAYREAGSTSTFTADAITVLIDSRTTVLEGDVRGKLVTERKNAHETRK